MTASPHKAENLPAATTNGFAWTANAVALEKAGRTRGGPIEQPFDLTGLGLVISDALFAGLRQGVQPGQAHDAARRVIRTRTFRFVRGYCRLPGCLPPPRSQCPNAGKEGCPGGGLPPHRQIPCRSPPGRPAGAPSTAAAGLAAGWAGSVCQRMFATAQSRSHAARWSADRKGPDGRGRRVHRVRSHTD